MDLYNYSVNNEDNFQDEFIEPIGYCRICDCEIIASDKYYHYGETDLLCENCMKNHVVEKCSKCGSYFDIDDLTKYEHNSKIYYLCKNDRPSDINEINFDELNPAIKF